MVQPPCQSGKAFLILMSMSPMVSIIKAYFTKPKPIRQINELCPPLSAISCSKAHIKTPRAHTLRQKQA